MNFIDFDYYKNVYLGKLDEADFSRVLVKAEAFLNASTHGRIKEADTLVSFCLCELCDVFCEAEERKISSESLDGYSVSYEKDEGNPAWEVVKTYLGGTGLLYGGDL